LHVEDREGLVSTVGAAGDGRARNVDVERSISRDGWLSQSVGFEELEKAPAQALHDVGREASQPPRGGGVDQDSISHVPTLRDAATAKEVNLS